MVATAPEQMSESGTPGWLDGFLADWETGTGEPREVREPATGRLLMTMNQSTADDVRRAAAAAAAAQPAWAETNYQERAAILRRAADIYEAHRAEFGTWTQRETGAHRNKMHHEQNFTAGRDPRRLDDAVAAVRLAGPHRAAGAPVDDPPRAGGRRRRDHAVELAQRPGHARGRAGARPRQRGDPQARSADARLWRRDVRGRLQGGGTARRAAPDRHRRRRGR